MGDVLVRDFDGNTLSCVWQYGLVDWCLLYSCLNTIIVSQDSWAIFLYDENAPGRRGSLCSVNDNEYPAPGTYIVLTPDGDPISVGLTPMRARLRHPTVSNTQTRAEAYRRRVRARDPCCLISGLQVRNNDFSRFAAAHIFPRARDTEWTNKGHPSLITDPAPFKEVGGPTKIDSIQNVILLRKDLHSAWDNYKIAVNPDREYVVVPFVPGYDDIAGKVLKLDHIQDHRYRPLDNLLRDHFVQAVLTNMKGTGEPTWDYDDAFGGGSIDLSMDIWGGETGKAHFEFEMAHRLHSIRVAQDGG